MRVNTSKGKWAAAAAGLCVVTFVLAGCEGPPDRLNAPPQGQSDMPSEMQDNYVRMADNAMLSERSMSPAHFVPGTSELNSLGVRRLNRYATLLKVYGGPLHYDGVEDEKEVADQRVYRIEQYLVSAGVGPDLFSVDVAPAGGKGMQGTESAEIRRGLAATEKTVQASQTQILLDDGK